MEAVGWGTLTHPVREPISIVVRAERAFPVSGEYVGLHTDFHTVIRHIGEAGPKVTHIVRSMQLVRTRRCRHRGSFENRDRITVGTLK